VLRGTHAGDPAAPGYHAEGPEADLYLEGHDQHRGWFHSALLIGCALNGRAPYRGLLTHGFTVDSQGRKMSKSLGNGVDPQATGQKLGAEIIRLWVAASDYSGDIAGDDKILARVVDGYRRIRNTLRFLMANTSDFDPAADAVATQDLLEIDRWALARAAQLQEEIVGTHDPVTGLFSGGHYGAYEFHPVVSKLQIFCSEDLGAFYLDVLKDRLYTTAPKSLARRSAQTALWQITQAMLRWMAPFLSFTAEEAWAIAGPVGKDGSERGSIFAETWWHLESPDEALLTRWGQIRRVRETSNRQIELLRAQGQVGSSLQAEVSIQANPEFTALLESLGDDLKFVLITSAANLLPLAEDAADDFNVAPAASTSPKCERCWHYRSDVGANPVYASLCGRCVLNLYGDGESRKVA
jgi:isoleucyl-tRNA synthetase